MVNYHDKKKSYICKLFGMSLYSKWSSRSLQPPTKIKSLESVTSSTMARVVLLKCMGANFFMKKQHYADMLRLAQTNCVNTVIEDKRK